MRKKTILIIILTVAILSVSYIFALEVYDTIPNKLEKLQEKVILPQITYDEIGVQLSGIQYEVPQSQETLKTMNEEMNTTLAHEIDCSKLCREPHVHLATTNINEEDQSLEIKSEDNGETWAYAFTLKNQKDVHYNMYYNLTITGNGDIKKLDTLRARGKMQLEEWGVEISESIYFKGIIQASLSKQEETHIKDKIFQNLSVKDISYYEDDLNASTCAYYGYTPWIKEYVKENSHEKSNVQVAFNYNDELHQTEVIIAFPFYNLPF